jgi:hypothetical protein
MCTVPCNVKGNGWVSKLNSVPGRGECIVILNNPHLIAELGSIRTFFLAVCRHPLFNFRSCSNVVSEIIAKLLFFCFCNFNSKLTSVVHTLTTCLGYYLYYSTSCKSKRT